ncbi:MAG: hypothetical protein JST00_33085 [Deltaproteobacteria bacterium]|nr:hypothetical protein [Deltaproteobacteria bacterium]
MRGPPRPLAFVGVAALALASVFTLPACDGSECRASEACDDTPVEHGVWVNMGGPPRPPPPNVDPVPLAPAVRLEGRFDTRDERGPRCAWPSCRATAVFEGNTARVTLAEQTEPWMTGGPSEWDVFVDGVWSWKLVAQPGVHEYTLVSGVHWGRHEVELYRRTEARYGTTQIRGFDFHVGVMQPAPARRHRRIEVVADTTASGLGLGGIGRGEGCPGGVDAATWQNARLAFPQRLADLLEAELDATVAAGAGVVQNRWRLDPTTMIERQERALPFETETTAAPTSGRQPFSFTRAPRPVDAIVVMIGESDFALGLPRDEGAPSEAALREAYGVLVDRLRQRAPTAEIFLATSPTASDASPPGRRTRTTIARATFAIAEQKRERGDLFVRAISPRAATPSERTACAGHGDAAFHERVARDLAETIRATSLTDRWWAR